MPRFLRRRDSASDTWQCWWDYTKKQGLNEFIWIRQTSRRRNISEEGNILTVKTIREQLEKRLERSTSCNDAYPVLKRPRWRKVMPRSKRLKSVIREEQDSSEIINALYGSIEALLAQGGSVSVDSMPLHTWIPLFIRGRWVEGRGKLLSDSSIYAGAESYRTGLGRDPNARVQQRGVWYAGEGDRSPVSRHSKHYCQALDNVYDLGKLVLYFGR